MDLTAIPEWARLAFIAAAIPLLLGKLKVKGFLPTFFAASVVALLSFKSSIDNARLKNPELSIYNDLQLPRGFSSEDHRLKKRSIYLDYHPDRIKGQVDKETQMRIFTHKQNQLDVLLKTQKRELLDRYNITLARKPLDSE